MALQRQDSVVTYQPSGGLNNVSFAMDQMLQANMWKETQASAQTMYDIVEKQFNQDAVEQAQKDAPALIKRDGSGAILPPSSFDPPGLTSRAYRDAYKSAAYNLYSSSVEQDFQNYAGTVMAQHPTDVEAVRKKLDEKRAAIVNGLDPAYEPLITLRLNGMTGQALSRTTANVKLEENKVAAVNAQWAYDNVVLQAGRLAKTPDRFDREFIAANHAVLLTDFDRATSLMRQAGWSEAAISKAWADARLKTEISRDDQVIRSSVATAANYGEEEYTNWLMGLRKQINDRAKELGPDGPKYIAAMQDAVAYASGQNQLKVRSLELGKARERNDLVAAMTADLAAAGEREGPLAQDLLNTYRGRRNAVLTDASMSSADRLKTVAAYDSVISQGKSNLAENTSATVTSLYNQATAVSPESTPQQARGALNELRSIVNDPVLMAQLPTGVRNYAERAVGAIAANGAKVDMATTMAFGEAGHMTNAQIHEVAKKWIDSGRVGDVRTTPNAMMSPQELALWVEKAQTATKQREYTKALAISAQQQIEAGTMPSADELKARASMFPAFQTSDGLPLNFSNPQHVKDAIAYSNATMMIPEAISSRIKGVRMQSPEESQGATEFLYGVKGMMASKGFREETIVGELNRQLGADTVNFLQNVQRLGHETALKMAANPTTSDSRNLGKPEEKAVDDMDKAFGKILQDVGPNSEPGLPARIFGLTEEQKYVRQFLGADAPTIGGQFANALAQVIPGLGRPTSATYTSMVFSPEIMTTLKADATAIMRQHGQSIATANQGADPNKIAAWQALMARRDEFEILPDPNNKERGIVQYKTANTVVGNALGTGRLSDTELGRFGLGLYRGQEASRRAIDPTYESAIQPFQEDKVYMRRWVDPDTGAAKYVVSAQPKTGMMPVTLMELAEGDPRLTAVAKDIRETVSKDVREWAGLPLTRDDEIAATGSFLSKIWGTVTAPVYPFITNEVRQTKLGERLKEIGGKAEVSNFSETFHKDQPGTAEFIDWLIGGGQPVALPTRQVDMKRLVQTIMQTRDPNLEYKALNLNLLMRSNAPNSTQWVIDEAAKANKK